MNTETLLRTARALVARSEPTLLGALYPSVGADVMELLERGSSPAVDEALRLLAIVVSPIRGQELMFSVWLDSGFVDPDTRQFTYPYPNPRKRIDVLIAFDKAIKLAPTVVLDDEAQQVDAEAAKWRDVPMGQHWAHVMDKYSPPVLDPEDRKARGLPALNADGSYDVSRVQGPTSTADLLAALAPRKTATPKSVPVAPVAYVSKDLRALEEQQAYERMRWYDMARKAGMSAAELETGMNARRLVDLRALESGKR